MNTIHTIGVAAQIGRDKDRYSDGVEVPGNARWLYASGTPGIKPDETVPETIEEQATRPGRIFWPSWNLLAWG